MKPPFAYFGGKTRLAEQIAAALHTTPEDVVSQLREAAAGPFTEADRG